jgi:hypothetical protein
MKSYILASAQGNLVETVESTCGELSAVNHEIFANSGSIMNLNSAKTYFNTFSIRFLLQMRNLICADSKTDRFSNF